jgi:hypothetical protein
MILLDQETSDGASMWCTECGRHLAYNFLLDAWCCLFGCARIGITNEALWRLLKLLNPVA